ncbi:4Fe-4S binding protein [Sedimentibacter hydroxybenzoicus DSM 7310]|uniref:4Fe-4S binding protein n=1 Tax=Sedimentibacter hydroxybenzoicus DSM 7310 TaxID=1123245 RepID=A0A974BK93_SEDHY|nr:4Fe-4S binding protein [Sedimentibacter hydroxybenzoicus]NYB74416.1 4Fe-4S binding protein [Sedimentibacter hydroxybenzoicus DSM 7310]
MKIKRRAIIQTIFSLSVIAACIIYYLYINDFIDFRILSVGDLNPYGGWSALKSSLTDLSYRWRGISKSISLTIAISVSALLFGRFLCGYICPIGSLQDFFKFIGKRMNIKEIKLSKAKYFNPEILKYLILIFTMVLSILGIGKLISPYSPWLAYMNIFIGFNIYIGTFILFAIIIASLFIKRIFCRCFCPLGAFQALLYAVGPLKLYKSSNCDGCSACLKNCPVDIPYTDELTVSPECINCSECTSRTCINGRQGFSYRFAGKLIKRYLIISLIAFMSIYTLLPLTSSSKHVFSSSIVSDLNDGVYTGRGMGFGGFMDVEIVIKDNGITDIRTINHRETTGYYEEVFKEISKELKYSDNLNVEVISGATATSRGYLNAVRDAVSKSLNY